jgi:ribosomal protein L37AE/L43A
MKTEIRCPKCASTELERGKNQEVHCKQCGETFYFVTPQCGSKTNLERYDL